MISAPNFLEGFSTGAMSAAILMSKSEDHWTLLFLHLLHWIASFLHHATPDDGCLVLDATLIRVVTLERIFYRYPEYGAILSATSIGTFPVTSPFMHAFIYPCVGYILFLIKCGVVIWLPTVLLMMAVSIIFFLSHFLRRTRYTLSVGLTVIYHLLLGWAMYTEMQIPRDWGTPKSSIHSAVRYIAYILAGFEVALHYKLTPNRLQNVPTLIASTVLAPFGMMEFSKIWFLGPHVLVQAVDLRWASIQKEVCIFYLSYITTDMCLGLQYYPQYFTLLEGYVHHIGTGLLVLDAVKSGRVLTPMVVSMITETSTIVLSLCRVFPSTRKTVLRSVVFPVLFVLTRILSMLYVAYATVVTGQYPYTIAAVLFTAVNIHWLSRMTMTKRQNLESS